MRDFDAMWGVCGFDPKIPHIPAIYVDLHENYPQNTHYLPDNLTIFDAFVFCACYIWVWGCRCYIWVWGWCRWLYMLILGWCRWLYMLILGVGGPIYAHMVGLGVLYMQCGCGMGARW